MTKKNHTLSSETKMVQALRYLDKDSGAIVPPIQSTETYARDENYEIKKPYWYRRDGNETTLHAEKMIAELEEAAETLLFASGMSAATAVIDTLSPNAHVVIPKAMYHGVLQQFQAYEAKNRLRISYYTAGNLEELSNAMKRILHLFGSKHPIIQTGQLQTFLKQQILHIQKERKFLPTVQQHHLAQQKH